MRLTQSINDNPITSDTWEIRRRDNAMPGYRAIGNAALVRVRLFWRPIFPLRTRTQLAIGASGLGLVTWLTGSLGLGVVAVLALLVLREIDRFAIGPYMADRLDRFPDLERDWMAAIVRQLVQDGVLDTTRSCEIEIYPGKGTHQMRDLDCVIVNVEGDRSQKLPRATVDALGAELHAIGVRHLGAIRGWIQMSYARRSLLIYAMAPMSAHQRLALTMT